MADLALTELAEYHGVVIVEWGDVVESSFADHLVVALDLVPGDEEARVVTMAGTGTTWSRRWSVVCDATSDWAQ